MKRGELGPGAKSLERGSTFATPRSELARNSTTRAGRPSLKRSGFTPASDEQRAKISGRPSIVSGHGPCDPAHLWPRSLGGCDHRDCVIPLTREEHRAYDDGRLDILAELVGLGMVAELQHALGHANGDLIGLLNRVTGQRYAPEAQA